MQRKKKRALQNWTKAVVYFARAKAERNGTAPPVEAITAAMLTQSTIMRLPRWTGGCAARSQSSQVPEIEIRLGGKRQVFRNLFFLIFPEYIVFHYQ